MTWLRIISFIFLIMSAVFFPWPVVAALTVIFMAIFSWFLEAVVIGIILGVIYASKSGSMLFVFFSAGFASGLLIEEYSKKIIEGENIISRTLTAFSGGVSIFLFWLIFKLIINYV